ncbi:MAG: hypothetical protein RL348_1079 [Bacteroidota bacterium]|jgi:hypothetical protein
MALYNRSQKGKTDIEEHVKKEAWREVKNANISKIYF